MAIAKGSRSALYWKTESTYGVAPSGNYNTFPLNSETLDENINTIQAEDIRPDRINPSLRGGNIATGGNIVADFGPARSLTFMAHLLGAVGAVDTKQATGGAAPTALAQSSAYTLGQIVGGANNSRWVCILAGSTAAGEDSTDLVGTDDITLNAGAVAFRYLSGDLMASTAYKRGHLVKDNSGNNWICLKGGTTHSSVVKADLTGTSDKTITGATSTTLTFQYVGLASVPLYRHAMRGGIAWPAYGLTFEKAIKGGNSDLFVQFLGGRMNSLELAVPQEGIVKATWNALFASSTKLASTGAGTPLAVVGESPYSGFNAYVGLNDAAAAASRSIREFNLNLTNQAAEDAYIVGSRFRKDIPEGVRRSSGRMSMYFEDEAEYVYFKDEATVRLDLSLIWKGYMVSLNWPEVKLTGSGTPKISGSGIMTADYEWTAFVENGTYDVEVVAVNATSTLPT